MGSAAVLGRRRQTNKQTSQTMGRPTVQGASPGVGDSFYVHAGDVSDCLNRKREDAFKWRKFYSQSRRLYLFFSYLHITLIGFADFIYLIWLANYILFSGGCSYTEVATHPTRPMGCPGIPGELGVHGCNGWTLIFVLVCDFASTHMTFQD